VDIAEVSLVGLIGRAVPPAWPSLRQLNRYVPLVVDTENADAARAFAERDEAGRLAGGRATPPRRPE
jgi:hypothetical protein